MSNYTVFFTYMLKRNPTLNTGFKYSDAIHCNYINSVVLDDLVNKEVNLYFDNIDDFKFLNEDGTGGTGFTAHKIYMIVQKVVGTTGVTPTSNGWKIKDVTGYIHDYVPNSLLSAEDLTQTVFKVSMDEYDSLSNYNLYYLNYPFNGSDDLCFGDEIFFFGNVESDVKAVAYSTDISIYLPENEFNTSTNETWNETIPSVQITEVGVYDNNKELVAIGKLNNPIPKNNTIARTLLFGLDF